jgi:uncharacterized membrane protein YeaQ/YmgE (transglycosylase-associated protein family)
MEFLVWLVVGGAIGAAAGFIRRRSAGGPIVLHASVGVVGALIAGAILLPLLGIALQKHAGVANYFTGGLGVISVLEGVIGAVLLYLFVSTMAARRERLAAAN